MKKFFQITLLVLVICAVACSCASSKRAQVSCPAYSQKSNGFERLPY